MASLVETGRDTEEEFTDAETDEPHLLKLIAQES